jgi:hypothetical protein
MAGLRRIWSQCKIFRVVLVAALAYTLLRLAVQSLFLAVMLLPDKGVMGGLPDWAGAEGPMLPVDLQLYVEAADRLWARQSLYPVWDRIEIYQYSPAFALAFRPFLWLPSDLLIAVVHTLLHIVAYGLLYLCWGRIFRRLGLGRVEETWAWTLPVWLLFSQFWSDLGYLNVYIIVALLATLLIDAVLHERLGRSLLWLSIILQVKPHWAFVVAVPLLLGRRRFFLKLVILAAVVYAGVAGVTMLTVGASYGWDQYGDYFRLLYNMRRCFPWRGPSAPFLGYNHSITQIVVYLLGLSPATLRLGTAVKILLLTPIAVVGLLHLFRPVRSVGYKVLQLSLDFAFALYLGVFIWMDMVWELSLGIVVFTYLLGTLARRNARVWACAVFLPYALLDLWRLVSLAFSVLGLDVIAPGPYVLTDPAIYVPLVMFVILTFYALLVRRLWAALACRCPEWCALLPHVGDGASALGSSTREQALDAGFRHQGLTTAFVERSV